MKLPTVNMKDVMEDEEVEALAEAFFDLVRRWDGTNYNLYELFMKMLAEMAARHVMRMIRDGGMPLKVNNQK